MEVKKFQNLRFKVHEVPQGTELLIKFPELGACQEFRNYSKGDRNYVIRYICYAYDPGSDFYEEFADIFKIKEAAAELAEFPRNPKTGKFEAHVYEMMRMEIDGVNDMIIAFLSILNNHTWTQIHVNEQMFWEYSKLLSEPVKGKDSKQILEAANVKSKLREEIKIIANDLSGFYKQMFAGDEDLTELAKTKVKAITPETASQMIKRSA